ncbi:ATP-dependent Clp protease adapter protein ClpS [Microbacterium azadirachtae]|uniref:ATP-dependent Clp protease adapter protein ClpS n=1 Tax=Microbacterium azadirachtae TaxID=582680 RepID=A0A0F0KYJ5_9MICO|nr:ATP-dependent Clp protease adapter ClpS [Microbacterium azadirachtae]KJL25559.1 ATP-dependent Clp protease adapter protein ClpS [Microbacterium azadirachtae]
MSSPLSTPAVGERLDLQAAPAVPWELVVWDDPVNLMSYVVRVFRTYFGYPRDRATRLMLAVHNEGHAVVATGPRETMEVHAQAMHDYGLWATVRRAGE